MIFINKENENTKAFAVQALRESNKIKMYLTSVQKSNGLKKGNSIKDLGLFSPRIDKKVHF